MRDSFDRDITYLRLSVTDLCDLRCRYCMPAEGVEKKRHEDICSVEELLEIARAAVACGVRKVRLTGGEPLVRRGILDICRGVAAIPGVEELCLTTNGVRLPALADGLRSAGVDRLNVSLDTLRPDRYAYITRVGRLEDVFAGLRAAEAAGFTGTKLNVVLMKGFNGDEIGDFVRLTEDRDIRELRELIEEHVAATGSPLGRKILAAYRSYIPCFKKVMPRDYDRMLRSIAQYEEKGMSRQQAEIEAFYANTRA